jgi:hypothetical protein
MPEVIADDDRLFRRLAWAHLNEDGMVNSAAFKTPSSQRRRRGEFDPSISVELARLTTPEETLARAPRPGGGVGVLVAHHPRGLGFGVRHDPQPDNYAHPLIEGAASRDKSRRLAAAMTVLIAPQPPADV